MIKSVTVTNFKGEELKLTLTKPEESGLIIREIRGLGPPKVTINSSTLATTDGSLYNSSRLDNRNIVFDLMMMFDPLIEDARLKIYRYFPIKKPIKILVETDRRILEAEGYVESNEPDIFSEAESTQVSIICTDPFFYDLEESEMVFSGVRPRFEFPFSNESLTRNLIEMGEIRDDTRATFNYLGDADTGLTITIHFLATANDIRLYNVDTYEQMVIDTNQVATIIGAVADGGDDIIISTIKGKKSAKVLRNGVYTNIIGAISKDADWFQLTPGNNTFAFTAKGGEENLNVTFAYRTAYAGI